MALTHASLCRMSCPQLSPPASPSPPSLIVVACHLFDFIVFVLLDEIGCDVLCDCDRSIVVHTALRCECLSAYFSDTIVAHFFTHSPHFLRVPRQKPEKLIYHHTLLHLFARISLQIKGVSLFTHACHRFP